MIDDPVHDVIIVGAGAGGLYASYLLKKMGVQSLVLEAQDHVGGRTTALPAGSFVPFAVDIGAEWLHGEAGPVAMLVKENNWALEDLYNFYAPRTAEGAFVEGRLIEWASNRDPMMVQVRHVCDVLEETAASAEEEDAAGAHTDRTTVGDCVRQLVDRTSSPSAFNPRWMQLIDNFLGKTFASEMDKLGLQEFAREESDWPFGRKNYRLDDGFRVLVDFLARNGGTIRTNCPVSSIDWSMSDTPSNRKLVRLTSSACKEQFLARYVIVAVPLPILRDKDIRFVPQLPVSRQKALEKIGWGNGMKLVVSFSKEFYLPHGRHHHHHHHHGQASPAAESPRRGFVLVITDHPIINQWWYHGPSTRTLLSAASTTASGVKTPLTSSAVCTATAFIMSDSVQMAYALGEEDKLVALFLDMLDRAYGPAPGDSSSPAVIPSRHVVGHILYDWGKNPYIKGAYSSPGVGSCGCRETVAAPLGGCVFFAGEHTNTSASATVNSAMQTGARAVGQILMQKALGGPEGALGSL